MKKSLVILLIIFSISVSAVAQQATKADIQSLDTKITKLQEKVNDMDKRLVSVEVAVKEMDKRLSVQIASLYTFVRWAIGTLILVVLAVIALPQIFGYLRDKKEREEVQKKVERLEQDVAQLQTRITSPKT